MLEMPSRELGSLEIGEIMSLYDYKRKEDLRMFLQRVEHAVTRSIYVAEHSKRHGSCIVGSPHYRKNR